MRPDPRLAPARLRSIRRGAYWTRLAPSDAARPTLPPAPWPTEGDFAESLERAQDVPGHGRGVVIERVASITEVARSVRSRD